MKVFVSTMKVFVSSLNIVVLSVKDLVLSLNDRVADKSLSVCCAIAAVNQNVLAQILRHSH
jgi:hypothetical protein